jgi:transcriptional regulator with XRE-family HTH domain
MTRLQHVLREQRTTYTTVAERARLQARTVSQIASGETPIDNVSVGTLRKIAAALSVPVADLLEPEPMYPGDASTTRGERLSAAIRELMWPAAPAPYPSPVEHDEADDIASTTPDEFFGDMPDVDAGRG